MSLPQEFINTAFQAAEAAGQITLKYFRNIDAVNNKDKNSFDPVTIADQEAEKAIRKVIEANFSDHGIIGEEYSDKPQNSDYSWIIDPIDGTRAFISGLPVWGTLIGLLKHGKPIFGLMSQPFVDDLFYGDCQSAYLKNQNGIQKLKTSGVTELSKARVFCTTPDMFITEKSQQNFDKLHQACKTTRFGTDCYGHTALAAGWGDIVLEDDVKSFDILPIIPIIQGAGGIVTASDGSEFTSGGVLACANKTLHDQVLSLFS